MKSVNSTFAFFVKPFICDTIEYEFPLSEIIFSEKAAGESEVIDMKEDQALQMLHKASSRIESKYPKSKKALVVYFQFLAQHIAIFLCTPL